MNGSQDRHAARTVHTTGKHAVSANRHVSVQNAADRDSSVVKGHRRGGDALSFHRAVCTPSHNGMAYLIDHVQRAINGYRDASE